MTASLRELPGHRQTASRRQKLNWTAFATIGAATLAVILLPKNSTRFPGMLTLRVVGATAIVDLLDLAARANVSVCWVRFPQGLPAFAIPRIAYTDIVAVVIGGCAAALMSFADASVLSRTYAVRLGTKVDPNREMVGLGVANLAAGFFHGFPISSSSSRTPVAEAAGARTQLTGVVGAVAVALMLLVAPRSAPAFAFCSVGGGRHRLGNRLDPEISDLVRIFRIQRWEFWLSIVLFHRRGCLWGHPRHWISDRDRGY